MIDTSDHNLIPKSDKIRSASFTPGRGIGCCTLRNAEDHNHNNLCNWHQMLG